MSRPQRDRGPASVNLLLPRRAASAYFFVLSKGSSFTLRGSLSRGLPLDVFHIQSLAVGVAEAAFVTAGVDLAGTGVGSSWTSGLLQPTAAMATSKQNEILFMEET